MSRSISILSTAAIDGLNIELDVPDGISLNIDPFVNIVYEDDEALRAKTKDTTNRRIAVAFTSKHAVRAVAGIIEERPKNWVVYSLGKYTYSEAKEFFEACEVINAGDDAKEMAALLIANGVKELVFFCGDKRLDTLPKTLKQAAVKVTELVVYKNEWCAKQVNTRYDAILFYSPSGVHSFFGSNSVDDDTVLFAIGDTTAAAIYNYTKINIVAGRVAGKVELLKKAIQYFV